MESEKIRSRKWYPYAVASCIAVAFYVLLTHLDVVGGAIGTFIGYFKAVILGCVLAYLMNPLARWYQGHALKSVRKQPVRWTLSVALALITALLFLLVLLGMLIPQIVGSIATFAQNFNGYAASLQGILNSVNLPLAGTALDPAGLHALSENVLSEISEFLSNNAGRILSATAGAGKNIFTWVIALILSVYLLSAKEALKTGALRLMRALLRSRRAELVTEYFRRCDAILISFVVQSLMESLLVGAMNAIVMLLFRMQYVGLISVVVGVTNLIPTFGPIIGGVIGAFVLLLVNPIHAVIFVLFTFALQFIDGYVIKPRLFGNSLGVSGLLILVAGIVGGNMFGILGVLLAIPAAAILNFTYQDYLLPALERRNGQ